MDDTIRIEPPPAMDRRRSGRDTLRQHSGTTQPDGRGVEHLMRINKPRIHLIALTFCMFLAAATGQAAILATLNHGDSMTIAAIGTSLTAASNSTWFSQMGDWLTSEYPSQVTLFNEAIPSSASKYTSTYTSPGSGLDVQLAKALAHNPDAIFIEFAMNDAYTTYGISVDMSKENLQAMIDQINAWGSEHGKSVDIVVQTMNNEPNSGLRPNLPSYYQGYRDVAATNGLLLIDHYKDWANLYSTDLATWQKYVPDGVHPIALGTENVIIPEIKQALTSQVPEPATTTMLVGGLLGRLFHGWRKHK
jgi:lysophospholipase L1-like esterase